jgi:glycosyltransferase involved in cell wall biosynthesis
MPTVSVMMPVYNARPYVARAVESILAQGFTDFEFLILDDGSTDGSLAILEELASRDPRIRLVSRPNQGVGASRNEILSMARGEFVAVMDADDVAKPDRFTSQLEFLRDHPEVVCVGGAQEHIDSAGRLLWVHRDAEDDATIQDLALSGQCPINNSSAMMRREAVLSVGGYRAELAPSEDLDLFLRLGEVGRLANLPQVVTRYRIHEASLSGTQQGRQLEMTRRASDDACDRRGIARRLISVPPWRPTDRSSKHDYAVIFGWSGFSRGDRPMALHYGLRAVRLVPWRPGGWRLLACALLKKPVGRAT